MLSEVVGDFADKEETLEERDDLAFPTSSRSLFAVVAVVVVESVTLISTDPDRDLELRRSCCD